MPQYLHSKILCYIFLLLTSISNAQTLTNKLLGGNNSEFFTRNSLDGDGHPIIVQQTSDGGYIVASATLSSANGDVSGTNHGGNDIWVVKLSASGTIQWQKLIGGNQDEYAFQIHQTSDGGYIIGANSNSSQSGDVTETSHGDFDFWIVKLNNSGDILWNKLVGGADMDFLFDLNKTLDGGFIATGFSRSSQSGNIGDINKFDKDIWVVKFSSTGGISWNKLIGGNRTESAAAIHQTSDGGYIVGGHSDTDNNGEVTTSNHGYYDMWLAKLSSTGVVEWNKLYGGINYEGLFALQVTTDGGYIMAGLSQSSSDGDVVGNNRGGYDVWMVKVDNLGNIVWKKLVGGTGNEFVGNLYQNNDGSIMLAGYTDSSLSGEITATNHGDNDFWVTKFSSTGNIVWSKLYGGTGNDRAFSIIKNTVGNYIISGTTESSANGDVKQINKGLSDVWLLTVDDNGNILSDVVSKTDLSIKSFTKNPIVQKDSTGILSFTLKNESNTVATNIKVLLKIPYTPPFVIKNSQNCSKGTFDSNLWAIPELAAGDSCILNIVYQPTQSGIWYVEAEVLNTDQEDTDSSPNNGIDSEDDFARICFSIPINVSSEPFGMQLILEDPKLTSIQWYKDGQPILGENKNILQISALGKYGYSSNGYKCPDQGCCPFIVEKAIVAPNCCTPLEYILERKN